MRQIVRTVLSLLSVALVPVMTAAANPPAQTVLMFVPQEGVYYTEYLVMRRALEDAGYAVEVRSSSASAAGSYLIPNGSAVADAANSLPGSSYAAFQAQYMSAFGIAWSVADNTVPLAGIPVEGAIQSVPDMSNYAALVAVGGTGALAYRVDGSYAALGSSSATAVQAATLALNALALDALRSGKPVMAQCHSASLAAYWRIPGTSGPGAEALGYSLLKDGQSTGFPDADTPASLASLDITHRPNDPVTLSSPHPDLYLGGGEVGAGDSRVITTRDWYPQTVAHAGKTLVNVLRTYPPLAGQPAPLRTLVLHGGPVDQGNCGADNRSNDIPCNFGVGLNTPADYLDVVASLSAPGLVAQDGVELDVEQLSVTLPPASLPFDATSTDSISNYLSSFDSVVLFKHWSTGMTTALQQALVDFVDEGGGVVALHHALYNDVAWPFSKDIFVSELFGVQSHMSTWSGSTLQNQSLLFTQNGHFVTSFHLQSLPQPVTPPASWGAYPLPSRANGTGSVYQRVSLYDEIYNNWSVLPGNVFGSGLGQIEPLLSNTGTPDAQTHLAGFSKRLDPSGDGSEGRVVFMMAGERKESFAPTSHYARLVRNSVLWASNPAASEPGSEEPPAASLISGLSVVALSSEQSPHFADPGLFDGNVTGANGTRWTAQARYPQAAVIDLGNTYSVSRLDVHPYLSRAYRYRASLSHRPYSDYTAIVDRTANQTGYIVFSDEFAPVAGRYLRVEVQSVEGNVSPYVTLNEIAAFGVPMQAPVPVPSGAQLTGLSVASVSSQLAPQFAMPGLFDGVADGSNGTRWTAQAGLPQFVVIDLGATQTVRGVDVTPFQQRPYRYTVSIGADVNGPFEPVVDRSENRIASATFSDSFLPRQGRYLRLDVAGIWGDTTQYVTINELAVRGEP